MRHVEIHDAAGTLSQLVDAAEAGDRVILTRDGTPVVEIVCMPPAARGIRVGLHKGFFPEEFVKSVDQPLAGLLANWGPLDVAWPEIEDPPPESVTLRDVRGGR